jgi:uncharacterized protein
MNPRFLFLLALPFTIASHAAAASFDCKAASRPDERAICASRRLSEMDVEVSVRYEMLIGLVPMGTRGDMQEEQRNWLQQRAQCGANQKCLRASYATRIATLKNEYEQLKSRGPF